jgi:hypothetical protein
MTYDINGVRKYVSSGKCIAYPCMSYAKDANGSHPNGMVFLAMKAIDEGRAVLTLSKGVHVELQLDDFASFSLSLVYWHPETDGTKGRYESNDVVHLEAVTIPRTISEYYDVMQWPVPRPGTLESENQDKDPAIGLSWKGLENLGTYEYAPDSVREKFIVLQPDDVKSYSEQRQVTRERFPPSDDHRQWWFTVFGRLSKHSRLVMRLCDEGHQELAEHILRSGVVVCQEQLVAQKYLAKRDKYMTEFWKVHAGEFAVGLAFSSFHAELVAYAKLR